MNKIRIAVLVLLSLAAVIHTAHPADLPLKPKQRVIDRPRDIKPDAFEILFQEFREWLKTRGDQVQDLINPDKLRYSIMARQDRKAVAKDLAAKGMTTRQIAQVTGAHHSTIADDLAVGKPTKAVARAKSASVPTDDMPTEQEANRSHLLQLRPSVVR